MPEYGEAQRAAQAKYRQSGKRARIDLAIPAADAPSWDAYAARIGMQRAEMVRACVARCMALDGFVPLAYDQLAPTETAPPAPVLVEPVKRKPGRPRKAQPEPGQDEAPPVKRKRGRPRKTAPTE